MSITSLQKFTVPLAGGGQSVSSQGLLMPKLKYRFRVSFENFGLGTAVTELTKQVVDFARPSVNFNPQTIEVYNSQIHYAGKPSWETTTVNIRDDALGNVSKLVGEQIQKQFDFLEQASAISGVDYKFITRCEITDGGNGTAAPAVLETWELYGCFLSQVNYGDLNYGQSEPVQIALTIQFDNAVQTPVDSGVGQAFARFALGSTAT
jgi:hypothetical protein